MGGMAGEIGESRRSRSTNGGGRGRGRGWLADFPRNYVSRPDSARNGSKGAKLGKPAVTGDPRPIPFKSRDS